MLIGQKVGIIYVVIGCGNFWKTGLVQMLSSLLRTVVSGVIK